MWKDRMKNSSGHMGNVKVNKRNEKGGHDLCKIIQR